MSDWSLATASWRWPLSSCTHCSLQLASATFYASPKILKPLSPFSFAVLFFMQVGPRLLAAHPLSGVNALFA